MKTKNLTLFILLGILLNNIYSQNYTFNINTNGKRVCLAETEVNTNTPSITVKLLDYASNTTKTTNIYRRPLFGNGTDWVLVATNLPAGTNQWIDLDVSIGEVWEYQIRRQNTWSFNSQNYDAIGYTVGSLLADKSNYNGQVILLVAENIATGLPILYERLKKEFTGEGWFVNELIVPKANSWNSGDTVVGIRNQIINIYNNAPSNDKPKLLFILGHVPMPRSGSTLATAPDAHDQNKGARGCDAYYADIDGVFTDTATFNPGGLQTSLAENYPGDFKWDQDFFPSNIEMAFGRVDFEDIDDLNLSELEMMEIYLNKLSHYKNVENGFDMGVKNGFYAGFNNSNDGSFRILPNISKSENVYENTVGTPHPQWVQNNGPFKIYMQNREVPDITEWETYGMDAAVFSSDQSYWGYNDVPQNNWVYGRIRALIASNTKCVVALWTTTGANIFHQACSGAPLGLALKEIMNHNTLNNNVEKPPQEWDTEAWWNRTHFAYIGDPSLRLYQVKPASNLSITNINNQATLSWIASPDTNVIGYHVYKSTSEFGIYNRINSIPIQNLSFIDNNYQQNDWYMLRAVKIEESGCGKFINPSIGIFTQGNFILSDNSILEQQNLMVFPIPTDNRLEIEADFQIKSLTITSTDGRIMLYRQDINQNRFLLDVSNLKTGIYLLKIINQNQEIITRKVVIE